MTAEGARLRIEPVVSRPQTAQTGRVYLVTVDLRGGGAGSEWPYEEEEFTFGIALDGHPYLTCEALGHPSVVLHRFGGTYGPARFVVTAGPATGSAALRLTVSNGWGVPVRTARLPIEVVEGGPPDPPDGGPGTGVTVPMRAPGRTRAAAPPEPAPAEQDPRFHSRLTISFAGHNRAWASWIAGRLEPHGLQVVLQRFDVSAGGSAEDALGDLLLAGGRVLIVLSEWYFRLGPRSNEEWNTALRRVIPTGGERFAAVSITPAALPSAAAVLHAADLWGLDAAEAERRLLTRLGIDPSQALAGAADGPRFPLDQPDVWGGVPGRNTRFTGREGLLGEVHQQFQQAEPGAGVVALCGLSGVGKTHIATEYVHRFGSEYDVVWWVRAADRGTLREKLAALAPALGLVTGREYGERLRAVRDALRRGVPHRRWLIVLDGADQPDDIHDLVPSGPGHVLITSQNRGWGEYNSALIEVPLYDRAESVAFVRRRAPRLDEADADRLAEALGDLALALDQNAGALQDSDTPVDEYIEQLRHGADIEPGLKVAADFQMTYYTAFSILLNRLREDKPEAVDLLRLCAFFGPAPVPGAFLRQDPAVAAGMWPVAIGRLLQWSVVQLEEAGEGERLHIHPLVHQATRAYVRQEDRAALAARVHRALVAVDPRDPDDTLHWPVYADIVPHLNAPGLLESTDPQVQSLALDCLRYLYLATEYTAGLELSRRVLAAWQRADDDGSGHPRIWDLVHHHGNLLRATGDYVATEAADRAAWSRLRDDRGADHPDTLRAAAGLAADLRGLARYDDAEEVSAAIADATRQAHGPDDPRTLIADNNHAVSLRLLGRYAEALALDGATLGARRKLHGPVHRWTLLSEVACVEDLRLLGRYSEALARQRDSYAVHRSALGPDHPRTLRAGQNLALCEAATGDAAAAGELLAALLERAERVLDSTHPLTVIGCSLYACHQREHGDLDTARAFGERVLALYREQLGPAHPFTAGALGNHALVLRAAGEHAAGDAHAAQALAVMTAAVGPDHPWALACALNAADPERRGDSGALTGRAAALLGRDHPLTRACAEGRSWDFEPPTI
ncbi:FxSxx-COOH system tetratricopeptide repeat protein [Streptomyces sp. NPDC049040]|uniref:FxSxx-COOH system tetratricopeptide repeat protein n=1 Tax=Streptomyces sp. NPDC049040 TaxID=3365593 RepID=UPI0037143AA2